MPRSNLNAGNDALHAPAVANLNARKALFKLNDINTESFDRKVQSNDKRMNLNRNFNGTTEFGEFERSKNEFDCQIYKFGREILYYTGFSPCSHFTST